MMGTKTHDPNSIIIAIGPWLVTGYAKGTFVKVSRETDTFTDYAGADGEVTRARQRDRRGTIELVLTQSSPTNDYLSALARQDEQSGTAIVPVLVKDANGTTIHSAGEAWVKKPAESEYGEEVSTRTWTIRLAKLTMFNGGSVL